MAIISTGQITITDHNDAVSLSAFITANHARTQVYNPENKTYTPDWKTNVLTLTPSLFTSTSGGDDVIATAAVTSIKWFDGDQEITQTTTNYLLGAKVLTIRENVLSGTTTAKTFICEIRYLDSKTNSTLVQKCDITFSKSSNGSGTTIAQIQQPSGDVFKNGGGSELTAKADLLRAAGYDTTGNAFQWYRLDGASYTKLLVETDTLKGVTTNTLTVYPDAVAGLETFKVEITDNDSTSGTQGQIFSAYCTFIDQTDPILVKVESSAGETIKNGVGSTTLTARLFQSGSEIDAWEEAKENYEYTYTWSCADEFGEPRNFASGGATKVGKRLVVDQTDIINKGIFNVEVS